MAEIRSTISANASKFVKEIDKAKSRVDKFHRTIKNLGSVLALGFAVGKIKGFIDELDALGKRANDLKMTAGELKALSHEAEHVGMATSEFDDAMKSFIEKTASASSGVGTEAEQLKKLGVSLVDNNGNYKTTNQLLYEVADAYRENAGGAESAKIACDLFGGSGVKMVRVLEQGSQALRSQVKDFESYNQAVERASMVKQEIADGMSTLEKVFTIASGAFMMSVNKMTAYFKGEDYTKKLFDKANKRYDEQIKKQESLKRKAEEKAIAEAEANLKELEDSEKESLKEREKENEEYKKAQVELQKERIAQIEEERTDAEKNLHIKEALKNQESELQNLQAGTTAYAKAELAILKNQKKLRDLEHKEKERILQEEEKRQSALKKQKELSDKLLQLEKARKKVIENINQRSANARAETLENIGQRGGNTAVGKLVNKSKSYKEKAQTALADGRYNEYFRNSDRAKDSIGKAESKRKEQMQKKIESYEKLGNKTGANRLREEMHKEGFGKTEQTKEDIEKLKEIEENTKETKESLAKLLKGLEG